jgi:magnesium-protoporphyrin IX monomethyl ester (oxidative) cyclase
MKVLLLYPPIWQVVGFRTNCNNGLGLLYVGAVLRKADHEVRIIDTEVMGWDYSRIMTEIENWKPTHVGIGCLSNGLESAISITKIIKEKHPEIWVALGGAGPSAEPEFALKESGADSVSVGESETILDKSFGEKGIHQGCPVEDLDLLPDPAYDLLEPRIGSGAWNGNLPVPNISMPREAVVMWSRGCPHMCTFCSKASMKRGMPRTRNPIRIVNELKMLHEEFGINSIFVYDDELIGMSDKINKWLLEVVDLINEEIDGMVFKGQGRCSKRFTDYGLLVHMKHAGFFAMMMGCESGSEEVKKIIKKGTTNDDIRFTLKTLHEAKIKVYGFWMIGMPGETREEARKTENLIVEMCPYMDWIQVSVFSPLLGSDFFEEAIEKGWLKNFDRTRNYQVDTMLEMPYMSRDDIVKWQNKLYTVFRSCKINEGKDLAQ